MTDDEATAMPPFSCGGTRDMSRLRDPADHTGAIPQIAPTAWQPRAFRE